MKAYLTRRYHFPASHRLHNPAMSEAENCEIYGKCNNPYGHGHNYALEVTVAGAIDHETGMVCNLSVLDEFVKQNVLDVFDRGDPRSELRHFFVEVSMVHRRYHFALQNVFQLL